ncbi:hypothetical protein MMC10_003591 [Thelotrema lepadinum]|nr:hypothetical protein [Thelotrema lepadinum]
MSYSHAFRSKDELWRHPQRASEPYDNTMFASTSTGLIYFLLFAAGAYYLLRRSDILPPNAIQRVSWRCFIWLIPSSLVLALEKRNKVEMGTAGTYESYAESRTYGAKSEAVKRILGLDSRIYLDKFRQASSLPSIVKLDSSPKSAALPGLYNRDNECYQNSVIQGFAAMPSFTSFVNSLPSSASHEDDPPLNGALKAILDRLNDADQHGKAFWTPWALKSMSSWQQQDAQEYYSKVIDELEKEAAKSLQSQLRHDISSSLGCLTQGASLPRPERKPGSTLGEDAAHDLDTVPGNDTEDFLKRPLSTFTNPLEGMLAQRVGCLRCGFVEGLSLIPFNCLTLSLGMVRYCDIEDCLDVYTDLETISGVECARCTLTRQKKMLRKTMANFDQGNDTSKAKEYFEMARLRYEAVSRALEEQDFSETTLAQKCKIPAKSRVTTDKTRQAVIARLPKALAIHVNRSVFDENTGAQYKNFAAVSFPGILSLDPWCLGSKDAKDDDEVEKWESDPSKSMLRVDLASEDVHDGSETSLQASDKLYDLRAVITHYGTHGDGHYIAYRQSPQSITEGDSKTWWRLSDEEVVQVDEDIVLRQGNVFMLFYEQIDPESFRSRTTQPDQVDAAEEGTTSLPADVQNSNVLEEAMIIESDTEAVVAAAALNNGSQGADLATRPDSKNATPEISSTSDNRDIDIQDDLQTSKPLSHPLDSLPSEPRNHNDNNPISPPLRTAGEVASKDHSNESTAMRGMIPAA